MNLWRTSQVVRVRRGVNHLGRGDRATTPVLRRHRAMPTDLDSEIVRELIDDWVMARVSETD